jgi:tight adherence protein B
VRRGDGGRVTRRPAVSSRASPAVAETSIAVVLERLAVLLEAGVGPAPAWRHLAAVSQERADARVLVDMAEALAEGRPGGPALSAAVDALGAGSLRAGPRGGGVRRREAKGAQASGSADEWRQLAAVWAVAEASGSPMASCLRAQAEATRQVAQARRDAAVALSGPRATSRLVLALPAVGLLLGLVMGLDTLGVLFGSALGWVCLGGAASLVVAGRRWNHSLVRRATPSPAVPGLDLELLATALSGGGAIPAARRRVADAIEIHCATSSSSTPAEAIDGVLDLSQRAGVPAAALLRSSADERRRDARADTAMAAEKLGVALMLPLGVCILPAFLLVGVVPLVVALLSSTAGAL